MQRSVRHSAASPHKMPQASSGTAGITVSSDPRFAIGSPSRTSGRLFGLGGRADVGELIPEDLLENRADLDLGLGVQAPLSCVRLEDGSSCFLVHPVDGTVDQIGIK